jgi:hypothetical protein
MAHANLYKETDLAWAAGLIEGEGCFTIHSKRHPYLILDMTDKDVIEKLHSIFPFGNIRGPYRHKTRPEYKDRWRFDAYGPKARHIIINIFPYMCSRRKAKMKELMELE